MKSSAIELKNVSKVYKLYDAPIDRLKEAVSISKKKYHTEFNAVKDISFTLNKGETIGIIGKNGAGKSTLLKLITGVLNPTSGTIEVNGEICALLELGTGFNPEYTGIENIYLNGTMRGLTEQEMQGKVEGIIKFADIGDFIYQPVKTYSSGMFARLAFAVMISFKPDILIVDEALSVGDVFFQQKCNIYMKEQMEGVTKLLVTHDMASIAHMADRVIVLDRGSIVFEGDPLKGIEFYTRTVHNEVFQTNNNESDKEDVEEYVDELNEWKYTKEEDRSGAQEIIIEAVDFSVNEKPYNGFIKAKDIVKLKLLVRAHKSSEHLIYGYIVNDKFGNAIFGENTHSSDLGFDKVQNNTLNEISLEIKWPEIQEGEYFITLGIGEGYHEMQHIIQCWVHNIINVKNLEVTSMHALFNNKISRRETRKIINKG